MSTSFTPYAARGTAFVRRPKLFRTSSVRLAALYVALSLVSALVLFAVIYWSTVSFMTGQLDAAISDELGDIQEEWSTGGPGSLVHIVAQRANQDRSGDIGYLLEDRNGNVLAGDLSPIRPGPEALDLAWASRPSVRPRQMRARAIFLPNGDYLVVAKDATALHEVRQTIAQSFGLVVGVTLILAIAGGLLMSRGLLRRVDAVGRTSWGIVHGDLTQRVPIRGSEDEFDHLAASLNAMLDRIQALMEAMKRVSDDIAHDLRTPLTKLRQRLELARHKAKTADELRNAIDRSIADVDAILDTFAALLSIAQIEGKSGRANFEIVDLSELLRTVIEVYEPNAEEKGQALRAAIEPTLTLFGSYELLAQMFGNLIENAIRHSPAGATIDLRAADASSGTEVIISDTGPGIPEAERANVFRRFYRLERSRTTPGNGLGLSLVAAIAELHGTVVALADGKPGLAVTMMFPKAAQALPPRPLESTAVT